MEKYIKKVHSVDLSSILGAFTVGFEAIAEENGLDMDTMMETFNTALKPIKAPRVPQGLKPVKAKRPPTGYHLFSASVRDEVKDEIAEDGEKAAMPEVSKALGARWKALDEDEKEEWREKAKALKEDTESEPDKKSKKKGSKKTVKKTAPKKKVTKGKGKKASSDDEEEKPTKGKKVVPKKKTAPKKKTTKAKKVAEDDDE